MNIANLPTVFIKAVVSNGKVVAPIALAGLIALGLVEIVKELRK